MNSNPYIASTNKIETTTEFRLIIDSHNFGNLGGDLGRYVISFSYTKSLTSSGSLTLELAPVCEWRDIIQPDDYINFYVNTRVGEEDCIYNRGWVRIFFGFVNDIASNETADSNGSITVRYSLSATDFHKALEQTIIYNHPAIPATEIFGRNIAGIADALYRLGVVEQGSPRFLVMTTLYALMGYGKQWVLPPHYEEDIKSPPKNEIKYRGTDISKAVIGNIKSKLAKSRVKNDILEDIQKKRRDIIKYLSYRTDIKQTYINTERTKKDFAFGRVTAEGKVVFEKKEISGYSWKEVDTAFFGFRQITKLPDKEPEKSYVQLTPDGSAPHQEARSLLDVLCFDYMENCEGYYANAAGMWSFSGSVLQMLYSLVHPVLNEFFFDLRPTMDFLVSNGDSASDGIGQDLEGGLVMVPCFVLREMPFTYYPAEENRQDSYSTRSIDVSIIRDPSKDILLKDVYEKRLKEELKNLDEKKRKALEDFADENVDPIAFVDPCGSVWTQKNRVVDYGDVLGFNFDAMWEDPSMGAFLESPELPKNVLEAPESPIAIVARNRYKSLLKYNRGPRTLEHIEITSNDVKSASIGRGDQDLITGYDSVPVNLFQEADSRAYVRDYTPQFRMLLIRRHGLRYTEHQTYYTMSVDPAVFAFADRYDSRNPEEGNYIKVSEQEEYFFNKKYIELGFVDVNGVKKNVTADQIFNSVEWYMNIKVTIMRDMWDQHNLDYLKGTIDLRAFPGIRVGYRLDWIDRDLSFYVVGVSHSGRFGSPMMTSVSVTRGQPYRVPLPYYLPDNRKDENERGQSFKLGVSFPIADPSTGNADGFRQLTPPGIPGSVSNPNVWQNWFRDGIKITKLKQSGINIDPSRTKKEYSFLPGSVEPPE